MKLVGIVFLSMMVSFFVIQPVFADEANIPPTPLPTSPENTQVSSGLTNFFSGFTWISNGLIFHTPALFTNTITLSDGTTLSGLSTYRNIFSTIAIPLFVIIICAISFSHITHDNSTQLSYFLKRLVGVLALAITTPSLLSYSIEAVNLLNDAINQQNAFSLINFMLSYVSSNDFANLFKLTISPISFVLNPNSILQLILLVIAFGFFLIGFLYIIFQSVIRFISLLFLSVLAPLILPFALSPKTSHITNAYFRMWFTFLIQQPAFILGFAIVSSLLESLLKAHGGNIGSLFLFSGSLIFLGGVNVLVGRIFADGWTLVAANAQSFRGANIISSFGTQTVRDIKKGAFTGRPTGIRSAIGAYLATAKMPSSLLLQRFSKGVTDNNNYTSGSIAQPSFTKELVEKGVQAKDQEKGIVSLTGKGFLYTNPKTGLQEIYSSKQDAIQDGREEQEITKTRFNGNFLDLSHKEGKKYYNTRISKERKIQGVPFPTHLTPSADTIRGNNFLTIGEDILRQDNVNGVIVKRYGNNNGKKTKNRIIRIYKQKTV